MPSRGTPNNIKDIKGEKNKDRYNPDNIKVNKLTECPDAPDWINGRALNLFNKYCDLLIPLGIIAEHDINTLAMFSQLEAKMIKLWSADETPTMSMYSQYKSFAIEFGLTSLSREKMHGPGTSGKENRFSK